MNRFALLAVLIAALVAGCSTKFPYGISWDRHNFSSDYHLPKHVELIDTTNGETVWETDVPVGKQLVIDLQHDAKWTPNMSPATPATAMRWEIHDHGSFVSVLDNYKELSGNPVLLKMTIAERSVQAEDENAEPVPTAADTQ